jgi:hypothetical protein
VHCSGPASVYFLKMEFLEELFNSFLAKKGYELAKCQVSMCGAI